jgi:hypothetical protein
MQAQTAPNLGVDTMNAFLGNVISSSDNLAASGRIIAGTSVSSSIKNDDSIVIGGTTYTNAINDLDTAMAHIDTMTATTLSSDTLHGSLSAGVYAISGNAYLIDTLTLSGSNTDIYIFDIGDSLLVDSYSALIVGNVLPTNIYWRIHNSVVLQDSCFFQGIILAGGNINSGKYNHGRLNMLSDSSITLGFAQDDSVMIFTYYSWHQMNTLFNMTPWDISTFCGVNNPGLFFLAGLDTLVNSSGWPVDSTHTSMNYKIIPALINPHYCRKINSLAANQKNGFQYFIYQDSTSARYYLYKLDSNMNALPIFYFQVTLYGGGATCDNLGNYWWMSSLGNMNELVLNATTNEYVDQYNHSQFYQYGQPLGANGISDLVYDPINCNFYALSSFTGLQRLFGIEVNLSSYTSDTTWFSSWNDAGSQFAGNGVLALGSDFNIYSIKNGNGAGANVFRISYPFHSQTLNTFFDVNPGFAPTGNTADGSSFICYNPVTSFTVNPINYCNGGDSVSIASNTSTINGNTPGSNIKYAWSWGDGHDTTTTGTNLPATHIYASPGPYIITLTAPGCATTGTSSYSYSVIFSSPIGVTATSTNVLCYGDSTGTATANVSNGYTPYTYLWNPSGQTTSVAVNLGTGTYYVTVTDSNGCTATATTSITQPTSLNYFPPLIINDSCYGLNDGSAIILVNGGTLPYSYIWTTGQTTYTATNLYAGPDTMIVTDANGCIDTAIANITQPLSPLSLLMPAPTNVFCFGGNNGSAMVFVSGGTPFPSYHYLWSTIPTQTTATANALYAGTYYVTVTDANGCIAIDSVSITQPLSPLNLNIPAPTNVSCHGGNNGSAMVIVTGGTSPIASYSWSTSPVQTSPAVSSLSAGTYYVTVIDANGCMAIDSVIITEPAPITDSIKGTNPLCYGMANASVWVFDVSGGTPISFTNPYTYLWSPSGQTGITATALSPDTLGTTYTVTITDAMGCTKTDTITLFSPYPLRATFNTFTVPVGCLGNNPQLVAYGGQNATITVVPTGGTSPYSYLWSPHGGITATITTSDSTLKDTTYVNIMDVNGCLANATLYPYYYDRAARLVYASRNLFLENILKWDSLHPSCVDCETKNLLEWIHNNHINKLIIDGIYIHSGSCGSSGTGYSCACITPRGILNSIQYNESFHKRLAAFINSAKCKYGVKKVYAALSESDDRTNGTIKYSKLDVDTILAFNNKYDSAYGNGRPLVDGFWVDYEFWDNNYCANCCDITLNYCDSVPCTKCLPRHMCCTTTQNGCGDTAGVRANSTSYRAGGAWNAWTEYGFSQFDSLITYINATQSTNMVKPEVLVETNMSFNINETDPPFNMSSSGGGPYFPCTGCDFTQGLRFAQWLMNPSMIGSITMDLTVADGRGGAPDVDTASSYCPTDYHGCSILSPDLFLNSHVDNNHNYYTCPPDTNYPNDFSYTASNERQRCLDFLASFSTGQIPICPYFSTQDSSLNGGQQCLGNFMTADLQDTANHNHAHGSNCLTHSQHFIPDIHTTFMNQYNNVWKESFIQSLGGSHIALYTGSFGSLDFNKSQSPNRFGWGAYNPATAPHTDSANTIVLGSMEWFPMNSYPLVLDQFHGYNFTNYDSTFNDALDTVFPNPYLNLYPPFMAFMGTNDDHNDDSLNRTMDGYPDGWTIKSYTPCDSPIGCTSEVDMNLRKADIRKPIISRDLSVNIHPNPSDGNYYLDYSLPAGAGIIIITDISGREIYTATILGNKGVQKIDITTVNNGVYYWKVTSGNDIPHNGKIVVLK